MHTPGTVLFVSEYAGFLGGIEQYVFQVAQWLRGAGYRLELLYREKGRNVSEYLSPFNSASNTLEALSADFNAVIMHRIWDVSLAEHLLVHFGKRVALVVHDHDLYCPRRYYYTPFGRTNCQRAYSPIRCGLCGSLVAPRHWQSSLPAFLRSRFTDFHKRFELAKQIPHLIVLSEFMRDNLVRNGFSSQQIIVLPPAVSIPENCILPKTECFKNEPPLIGFVGQLIRGKGTEIFLDVLQEIARRNKRFQGVIVGDGPDKEMLNKRVEASGLNVKMTGFIQSPQEWYSRCDLLLLPFRWQEPFGLVGVEAAANALPVVASDLGGMHAWMIPGKTGIAVQTENVPAFADAVCSLLDNPALCAQMGIQAREFANQAFSIDSFLAGFEKALEVIAPVCHSPKEGTSSDTPDVSESNDHQGSPAPQASLLSGKADATPTPVSPLRILVDTLPFDHGQSGISEYTRAVIKALENAGHQVTVLSVPADKQFFTGSHLILTPAWAKSAIGSILYHLVCLPRMLRPCDYDFCLIAAANRRFPLNSSIPVIGTIHDLAQCHNKKLYGPLHNFYLNHILAHLVRRVATRIVAVSQATSDDIVTFWKIPPKHIGLIPNGLSLPKRDEEGFLERYGLKAGHFILYVSRIAPNKNHIRLVKAYEKLPEHLRNEQKLVFVGSNEGWGDKELDKTVQESKLKENIVFTGYVPEEYKAEAYRSASLHVFPSKMEGFGFPLIEAMHFGCPCCCSNNSSLGEFGKDAALLFPPMDVDAMRDSIQTILEDRDGIREKLVEAGYRRAKNFSWEHHVTEIVRLYENAKDAGEIQG